MFQELANSSVVRTALILLAAFGLAAFFVPGGLLVAVLNYALLGVGIAVLINFLPGIWAAITARKVDYVDQLTLGIGLGWAAIVLMRSAITAGRVAGTDLSQSFVVALYLYMGVLAGVLHITAPSQLSEHSARRSRVLLGLAMGIGGLVAGVLLGMQLSAHA